MASRVITLESRWNHAGITLEYALFIISKMGVGKEFDEAFEKCGNVGLLSIKVASSRKIDDITANEFRHCLRQLDNILAT